MYKHNSLRKDTSWAIGINKKQSLLYPTVVQIISHNNSPSTRPHEIQDCVCWWSLWILLVLFKFVWTKRVLSIINSAKIEMISYLPLIQDRIFMFLTQKIHFSMLKLKIFRTKDSDWRSWTHASCSLMYFDTPFPLITWASAIHFSDSQNSS